MPLVHPKFIDHNVYDSGSGFTVTNEEPELFHQFLGKSKFQKVGGICSCGDILLSQLLPRTDNEVTVVDHSYRSLASAYARILAFQQHSWSAIRKLMLTENYDELGNIFGGIVEQLPAILKPYTSMVPFIKGGNSYNRTEVRRDWGINKFRLDNHTKEALKRITLIHGDLKDLKDLYGAGFDLFYTSNAHEHTGRAGSKLSFRCYADFVAPGGLLVYTSNSTYPEKNKAWVQAPKLWKELYYIRGYRQQWYYGIAERLA